MRNGGFSRRAYLAYVGAVSWLAGIGTAEADAQAELRSISYGETKQGEIDAEDGRDPVYDDLAEPVSFEGEQGDVVEITMTSDALDPYLVLAAPDGSAAGQDDDGASGLNSRLETTLGQSGSYTIWAGSFSGDATGPYTLSLEKVGESGGGDGGGGGTDLRSISYGQTREGEIDQNDPQGYRGYYEPVTFSGDRGDVVTVEMTTEGDPFLMLQDPSGSIVTRNDDGGSGLNARIENYELGSSGEYTIVATSYSNGATFTYTLSLERTGQGGGDGSGGTDLRSISYGQTLEGEIDGNDPTGYRGHYEPVTFSGSRGDVVTVSMQSDVGDTYLLLQDPGGSVVAENDDGGGGLNSRIEGRQLSADGEYTIVATSYDHGATFPYTLSLSNQESTPPSAPDPVYTVEGRPLGASPTRAIFSITIRPNADATSEYQTGTVSGLQVNTIPDGVRIARLTPLPAEDGTIFSAAGSILLGTASIVGGPLSTAAATSISLFTASIELTKEVQQHNIDNTEGTRAAVFTGQGGMSFLSSPVRYLVELEKTDGPINEDDTVGADWKNAFTVTYSAEPDQPPSSTDSGPRTYTPALAGPLFTDREPFVDHVDE